MTWASEAAVEPVMGRQSFDNSRGVRQTRDISPRLYRLGLQQVRAPEQPPAEIVPFMSFFEPIE
jgi:hypothetical protein